jgi:hypothetical protein
VFAACSGAVIDNVRDVDSKVQYPNGLAIDQQPQITQVDKYQLDPKRYVRYISLTIGGNNADFSGIVQFCVEAHLSTASACIKQAKKIDGYDSETKTYSALTTIHIELHSLYRELLDAAPDADILVMDYPQLFNTKRSLLRVSHQSRRALGPRQPGRQGEATIQSAATTNLRGGDRIHFVQLDGKGGAFDNHKLCRPLLNRNRTWINGLEAISGPKKLYTARPDGRGHHWIQSQLDAKMKSYL